VSSGSRIKYHHSTYIILDFFTARKIYFEKVIPKSIRKYKYSICTVIYVFDIFDDHLNDGCFIAKPLTLALRTSVQGS